MSDMLVTIVPKSDQLNSDDLIGGRTLTITITRVTVGGGPEQPVSVYFAEGEGQRKPWKPGKSMCRVLVHVWGANSQEYVGRSLTLYRDEKVKFGGMEVGGLRISHMSHIPQDVTLALTASKARRASFVVKPLPGDWTAEKPKAKPAKPARDWEAELKAAANIADLGKVWTAIPAGEQKKLATIKDARKAELSKPAEPETDILALIDELTAMPGGADMLNALYREDGVTVDDMEQNKPHYATKLTVLIRQAQEINGA